VALSRPEGIVFLFAALLARALLLWRDNASPTRPTPGSSRSPSRPSCCISCGGTPSTARGGPHVLRESFRGAGHLRRRRALPLPAIGATLWGNALLLPLLLLGLLPWKKTSPRTLLLLLGIGAQAGFMVLGGGDWMLGCGSPCPRWRRSRAAPTILARLRDALHRQRLAEWFAGA
jgi:hypothetical protein